MEKSIQQYEIVLELYLLCTDFLETYFRSMENLGLVYSLSVV